MEKGKGGGNPALPRGVQANKRIPGGRCQEGEGAGCSLSSPAVTACPVTNPGGPRDAVTHRPYFGKLRQGHSSCSASRCQGPSSSGRRLGHGPRCHCGFLWVSAGVCGFLRDAAVAASGRGDVGGTTSTTCAGLAPRQKAASSPARPPHQDPPLPSGARQPPQHLHREGKAQV